MLLGTIKIRIRKNKIYLYLMLLCRIFIYKLLTCCDKNILYQNWWEIKNECTDFMNLFLWFIHLKANRKPSYPAINTVYPKAIQLLISSKSSMKLFKLCFDGTLSYWCSKEVRWNETISILYIKRHVSYTHNILC